MCVYIYPSLCTVHSIEVLRVVILPVGGLIETKKTKNSILIDRKLLNYV